MLSKCLGVLKLMLKIIGVDVCKVKIKCYLSTPMFCVFSLWFSRKKQLTPKSLVSVLFLFVRRLVIIINTVCFISCFHFRLFEIEVRQQTVNAKRSSASALGICRRIAFGVFVLEPICYFLVCFPSQPWLSNFWRILSAVIDAGS